jgi:menaquinone-specific isochorismate synthase
VKSTTVRLDAELDPLTIGAENGLLWSREGFTIAGIGEALRIPITRPGGFATAQAELAALAGPSEFDAPGAGPVGFGAFDFDPASPGELIVPHLLVGGGTDGRRWLTIVDDGSLAPDDARRQLLEIQDHRPTTDTAPGRYELTAAITPDRWCDEVISAARAEIQSGLLQKAVLARELRLQTDLPIEPAAVIARLAEAFPTAIIFNVDGFLGASPELLVSRRDDIVRAHPLAGTAPRASDPNRDQQLAAGLLASAKDRTEHLITIEWLLDSLLPYCSYVDAEPEPSIVSLANVHHLGTLVEGRLSTPAASVLELVAALHPTPAVGGDPQAAALELIAELEGTERGRYAGPVGWVDAEGNGAFAVGIRSAEIDGNHARLFAGVGVVADSEPRAELAETRQKFQAMLGALIRP